MNLDSKCIEEWSVQATRFFLDKGIYSRELVFSQLVKALGINIFNFFSKDWILNAADQQILEIADQLNVTDAEEFKALLKGDVAHCENWSNDFIVDWIMVRGFAVKLDLKKVITRAGNLEHNLSRYLDSFFGVPVSTVEIQELMKGLGILESKQFSSGKIEIHDAAWNQEYRENNARKRLLLHLCAQEERLKSISCHWPCVAVIQSSGYGKSRLVKEMLKKENWRMNDPVKRNVIYWNFGKPEHNGYPRGNRLDLPSLSLCRNDVIEEFKIQMLEEIGVIDDGATGIWFIVDERADPSFRPDEEKKDSLDPFILAETFDVFVREKRLLDASIQALSNSSLLYQCGRPLWGAYLQAGYDLRKLIYYARQKITASLNPDECDDFTAYLACLAVQFTLQISPTSVYASQMLESHMATCVGISKTRESIFIAYPSEPILAIAAMIQMHNPNFRLSSYEALLSSISYGAVKKGHRGEILAQILLLRAFQAETLCSYEFDPNMLLPISLKSFLKQFSRSNASIPDQYFNLFTSSSDVHVFEGKNSAEKLVLERYFESEFELEDEEYLIPEVDVMQGQVFFTHFVYLSSTDRAQISHDTLKYCFKRTAAIVMESGRAGIDIVIPIHLSNEKFIGLLIQAKNRIRDSLDQIVALSNPETHYKFRFSYIFSEFEQNSFRDAGVSTQNWPGLFLALGVDERGAAVAVRSRKKTRNSIIIDPSVLVLTGIDFQFFTKDEREILRKFRDFEMDVPDYIRDSFPITYGTLG